MSMIPSDLPGAGNSVSAESIIHQARQLDAMGRAQVVSVLMGGPLPLQAVPTEAERISQQAEASPIDPIQDLAGGDGRSHGRLGWPIRGQTAVR